jgi:hypothetical protein
MLLQETQDGKVALAEMAGEVAEVELLLAVSEEMRGVTHV